MDRKDIRASLGKNKEVLLKKGAQCRSAEEILQLARDNSVTLDESGAIELFAAMHRNTGRLSDDELDSVAGGMEKITCPYCGFDGLCVDSPQCPVCKHVF